MSILKIIVIFIISILLAVGVMYGMLVYIGYSVSDILFFAVREFLLLIFLATLVTMMFVIYEVHCDRPLGHSSLILGVIIVTLIMGWGTYAYATQGRILKKTFVSVENIPFKTIIRLPITDTEGNTTYEAVYIWRHTKTAAVYKMSLINDSNINSSIDISQVYDEADIVTQYHRNTDNLWDSYWYTTLYKRLLSSDKIYKNTIHYFVLLLAISLSTVSGLFLTRLFKHPIITVGFILQWYMGLSVLSSHIVENLIVLELLLFITFVVGYCMYRLTQHNNKHDVLEYIHDSTSPKDFDYIIR